MTIRCANCDPDESIIRIKGPMRVDFYILPPRKQRGDHCIHKHQQGSRGNRKRWMCAATGPSEVDGQETVRGEGRPDETWSST